MDQDEVTSLPGWNGPLPSRIYSGFLESSTEAAETTEHMHCKIVFFSREKSFRSMFVLTYHQSPTDIFIESENDPSNDPVLVWSNGGPGAGSEFGLFTELGPFLLSDSSTRSEEYNRTGVPTLYRNEFAWTKFASILIYDAPPPVGFSYCGDDVSGDGYSCGGTVFSFAARDITAPFVMMSSSWIALMSSSINLTCTYPYRAR